MSPEQKRALIAETIEVAKNKKSSFAARWGACHFLCMAEQEGLGNYAGFVKYQDALLQALLAPALPDRRFTVDRLLLNFLLQRSFFEPGIALAKEIARHELAFSDLDGVDTNQLPTQVRNVFQSVGIITTETGPVDPMGEILTRRYGIDQWTGWKILFGPEYVHAVQILSQADPVFDSGRSHWLSHQNSFNHALFIALQKHFNKKSLSGAMKTHDSHGHIIDFGSLLDINKPFAKHYSSIAVAFRDVNKRRNALPGSHPYEKKGGARAQHLKKGEQTVLVKKLSVAYGEIIKIASPIIF